MSARVDTGVDFLGRVPEDWTFDKLKYVLTLSREKNGGTPVGEMLSVSEYTGVEPKVYDHEEQKRSDEELADYRVVRRGQLVVNTMWLNHAGLGVSNYEGYVSPAYRAYWVGPDFERRYLHHLVRSRPYVDHYCSLLYGIRPNSYQVKGTDFDSTPLLRPPLRAQNGIADYLDSEAARIDALIDRKQRFIDLLVEKRTALITRAVTRGLDSNVAMKDSGVPFIGRTPAHWEVGALRRWWSVIDCKHRTVEPAIEGVPMVSIGQVQNARIDCSDARLAGPDDYSDLIEAGRDPRRGDVVYSRNASVGLVALVDTDDPVCLGQDVCMLRSRFGINGLYLTYQLRSLVGAEQLRALQRGPTFNRINVGILRAFVVCQPPADEQAKIASFIEKETACIDALIDRTQRSIELLREYRRALISSAVTGQIDIPGTKTSEEVA